jgi:uncharacterized membrane protein YdbT with pleckstrin-like domain
MVRDIQRRYNLDLLPGEQPISVQQRHWIVLVRRIWWLAIVLAVVLFVGQRWLFHQQGPIPLGPGIIVAAVLAMIAVLVSFFLVDWRNDMLLLTNQRIVHVEKVVLIFVSQQESALDRIQDVRSSVRGFVARILGYGEVQIETAARGTDIVFGPISNPKAFAQQLMNQVQSIRDETSAEMMRETLLRRLHELDPERYPLPKTSGLPAKETEATVPRRRGFRLIPPNPRVERDTITWCKHWFFMIGRLLWPSLMLCILIAAAFFLPGLGLGRSIWIVWGVALGILLLTLVIQYQLWLGDIYVLTPDRLLDINRTPFGIFGETRRTADLERIQNITFEKPGLLANLFNFGNLRVQTAGEEDFTFDRVPRPENVQREIYRRQELGRQRAELRRREEIAETLAMLRELEGQSGGN